MWGTQYKHTEAEALESLNAFLRGKTEEEIREALETQLEDDLHYACSRGWPAVAKKLLDVGADVNLTDEDEFSPLHRACNRSLNGVGATECVKVLIETGKADSNLADLQGKTPLHCATSLRGPRGNEGLERVRLLVEAGADVNAKDKEGSAPLHFVQAPESTRRLIQAGADVNMKNQRGETPLCRQLFELEEDGMIQFRIFDFVPETVKLMIKNGDFSQKCIKGTLYPLDEESLGLAEEDEVMLSPIDCITLALDAEADPCNTVNVNSCLQHSIDFLAGVVPTMEEKSSDELRNANPNLLNSAVVGGQMLQRIANEFMGDTVDDFMALATPLLEMGGNVNISGKPPDMSGCISYAKQDGFTPLHYLLSPFREALLNRHNNGGWGEGGVDGYSIS